MTEKAKTLLIRYRKQGTYLIVGGATTVLNYCIYTPLVLFSHFFRENYRFANALAWIVCVTFAYFANRTWVYRSTEQRNFREAGNFVLSRVFSLVLETLLLTFLVELLHADKLFSKLVVSVITVIVNYLTGALVFQKSKG